jgi:hypothetical protein
MATNAGKAPNREGVARCSACGHLVREHGRREHARVWRWLATCWIGTSARATSSGSKWARRHDAESYSFGPDDCLGSVCPCPARQVWQVWRFRYCDGSGPQRGSGNGSGFSVGLVGQPCRTRPGMGRHASVAASIRASPEVFVRREPVRDHRRDRIAERRGRQVGSRSQGLQLPRKLVPGGRSMRPLYADRVAEQQSCRLRVSTGPWTGNLGL